VNAYKLTVHLGLGITLFIYLNYTWWKEMSLTKVEVTVGWAKAVQALIILVIIQICLGGFVSGMKAALNYPTWPLMNGVFMPQILMDTSHWNMDAVLLYDQSGFMPALVQFKHRVIAYVIFIAVLVFTIQWVKSTPNPKHWIGYGLFGLVLLQVLLGIFTLLGSKGEIPVSFGALHQMVGILLLTFLFFIRFRFKKTDRLA
jgi:heme a synthase